MSGSSREALFFPLDGLTHAEQLAEVIRQIAVRAAFCQQFEILPHQGWSAPQKEGDFSRLSSAPGELRDAGEGGEIVGNRFGRMFEAAADFGGGLAFQR